MIVIVTGSRHYAEWHLVKDALDSEWMRWKAYRLPNQTFTVYHGKAKGADALAGYWVGSQRMSGTGGQVMFYHPGVREFPADWDKHGRAAGAIRNREMVNAALETGDEIVVLAFPLPSSKGTFDCMGYAKSKGLTVQCMS